MTAADLSKAVLNIGIGLGAALAGIAALLAAHSSYLHYQTMGESSLGGDWVMQVNGLNGEVRVCSTRFGCSPPVTPSEPKSSLPNRLPPVSSGL
ncbi:MAG: hypothetical protein K2X07_05025 [Caulobacteraceae bacterium]|nr:hypothetical protein [Caulobacteraceae bacterium]